MTKMIDYVEVIVDTLDADRKRTISCTILYISDAKSTCKFIVMVGVEGHPIAAGQCRSSSEVSASEP